MTAIFDDAREAWDNPLTYVDPQARTGHRAHWNGEKVGLTPESDHGDCLAKVRAFHNYHVNVKGWLAIGYNLLICPHGIVIEGRGVDYVGGHSKGSNVTEYGTQFMVGEGDEIPEAMFAAFSELHDALEEHSGHELALNVHRDPPDTSGTTCPGDEIAERVHAMRPTEPTPEPPPVVEPEPAPTPETPTPPAPPPPPTTKDTTGETIRRGDRGAAVAVAQRRLTAHGYPATADGIFGLATETAARNFQDARGLDIDGVIGRDTWRELLEQTPQERAAEARDILTGLGWRTDTTSRFVQAVKDFQRMWAFGSPLDIDGIVGPVTIAALRESKRIGGKVSPNFKASEFACKCGGRYASCRRIWAHRALVLGAEKYRTIAGPFTPISACRCWDHNKAVGGYYRSQHLHGLAMDVTARFSVAKVTALGVFPAIGYNRSTGTVRHVDFRNLGLDNYPRASGSVTNPYRYIYG